MTGRPLAVVENHLKAGAAGAALTMAVGLGIHPNMDAVNDLIGIKRVLQLKAPGRSVMMTFTESTEH